MDPQMSPEVAQLCDQLETMVGADFRGQIEQSVHGMIKIGVKPSEIDFTDKDAMLKKIIESPLAQVLRRTFGPNWHSYQEQIGVLTVIFSDDAIESRGPAQARANKVVEYWRQLQALQESGRLDHFREDWALLETSRRRSWLREHYPVLFDSPHLDIYGWAQNSGAENKHVDKGVFITPLLNVEALSEDDVLPSLLQARASSHPRWFRAIDGRSVSLGIFVGSLQLRAKGEIEFTNPTDADPYGMSFPDGRHPLNLSTQNAEPASSVILGLEAQCRTYKFLVSCAADRPVLDKGKFASESAVSEPLSLLARITRTDYYGHLETVDVSYLDRLVKSSLIDAVDTLREVREDSELWDRHWRRTSAKRPGRLSNFLLPIFHRIGIFSSLSLSLDVIQAPDSAEATPDLTSLYAAFECTLGEELHRFQDIDWSPPKSASTTFTMLFDMLKKNHPAIYIMRLPQMMRVLDLELRKDGSIIEMPFSVMQSLNDISILAVCVRESWKQYNSKSLLGHVSVVNELEATWAKRQCPWEAVAANTLKALSPDERRKLQVYNSRHKEPRLGHAQFWSVVEQHMMESTSDKKSEEIIDMIHQIAPISTWEPPETTLTDPWMNFDTIPGPSKTQIQRSKPHKWQGPVNSSPADTSPAMLVAKEPLLQQPVVIRPTRDRSFWSKFLAPSSENKSEIRWPDFCKAMEGIGYKIYPQTGSVYRFESHKSDMEGRKPGTIVFHAPHGTGKVTRGRAESWRKRLLYRVCISL